MNVPVFVYLFLKLVKMSSTGTRKPNGSGTIRSDGYIQIKLPGHPVSGVRDFAFLHRKVLYDKIGPGTHSCYYCNVEITWFVNLECDHKDHDKLNNDPDNLVPCCVGCNRTRWNTEKTECPNNHGPYDKQYKNGWRYCSKCKAEKEKRRRKRIKEKN
jgi:hypothetical protein